MSKESYDLVMCIGYQHIEIAKTTLKYVLENLDSENIYLITQPIYFNNFRILLKEHKNIHLIDENQFEAINHSQLKLFLQNQVNCKKEVDGTFNNF